MTEPCEVVGRALTLGLVAELHAVPAPGLVTIAGQGAHDDMDAWTLTRSARTLEPFFAAGAEAGCRTSASSIADGVLFDELRTIGLDAERAMLSSTDGVNTHRGAVFLGLLVAGAAGQLLATGRGADRAAICDLVADLARLRCANELDAIRHGSQRITSTTGTRAVRELGMHGVRGVALGGLQPIRGILPPDARTCLDPNAWFAQLATTRFSIMAELEDTTVLNRAFEPVRLAAVQLQARAIVAAGGTSSERGRQLISAMEAWCVHQRISPGGSGDLLALVACFGFLDEAVGGRHSRSSRSAARGALEAWLADPRAGVAADSRHSPVGCTVR